MSKVTLESIGLQNQVERNTSNTMDKDAFLQLLVTQMKYQDPLAPMDNQEMLAQLAQFSALEQMQNVATLTEKQVAVNMVGKYVEYVDKDANVQIGLVDSITLKGNKVLLNTNGIEIQSSDVVGIIDGSNIVDNNQSVYDLLGQTIQAVLETEDGKTIVEGSVVEIRVKDNEPYVVLGKGDSELEVQANLVQNTIKKPSITDKYITATYLNAEGEKVNVEGTVDFIIMGKSATYVHMDGHIFDYDYITSIKYPNK